jgi:lipopolysaccharide transport system permease protein
MLQNIWRSRELIWQLFKRDFLAQYKKSFMGYSWIFLMPILGVISWIFMQKTGLLNPGKMDIPYPAYVLIGTSMWGLFMGFYSAGVQTLESGKDLVMQVNFPHEALLFKTTAEHLAQFVIAFALNIVVLLLFRVVPSWGTLLFPVVALPLFFLGASMGLVVSMVNVVAIDVSRGIGIIMGLIMFVTPVIYSDKVEEVFKNPIILALVKWNPLTYLVCSCRDIIIYGRLYDPLGYALSTGLALFLFLVSWRLFYISEHKLIERMI